LIYFSILFIELRFVSEFSLVFLSRCSLFFGLLFGGRPCRVGFPAGCASLSLPVEPPLLRRPFARSLELQPLSPLHPSTMDFLKKAANATAAAAKSAAGQFQGERESGRSREAGVRDARPFETNGRGTRQTGRGQ
jgi:hypothetical protein